MGLVGAARVAPVRVVIVDDSEDIRAMLHVQFDHDARFTVVAEGGNGYEAIRIAEREQPDLLILDDHMPHVTGVEAIPEIRRVSPRTAIVLYTAHGDRGAYQAAIDAGALEVLEKVALARSFVDRLVDSVLERAATEKATIEIHMGPVSSRAARVWIENTTKILDAVAARPDVLGAAIPDDVLDLFRTFLSQWRAMAEGTDEFRWVARADPDAVQLAVGHWAQIDAMSDEQLAELGVGWAPPEGAPFFEALTTGVIEAMHRHEETRRLAERVGAQFSAYVTENR
jgi:CheY-like chemotaxis protein